MAGKPKINEDRARLREDARLVELVWELLEQGRTYAVICRATGIGKNVLTEYLHDPANAVRFDRARAGGAHNLVSEALSIADASGDPKLRVGQRNWMAERMNRLAYGQKLDVQHAGSVVHLHLEALRHRAVRDEPEAIEVLDGQVQDVVPKTLEQQLDEL